MDYSKANEVLNMFGGDFQKMMEGLSDWAEKMVKSNKSKEEEDISISTLFRETKVETFESDDVEPIFLLKYYTIENIPYEIWSKVEPDWNKFCRNYAVLLNKYNNKKG